ncbi:aspartate aminotransferase family protein [Rhizobium sp. TH2]|uniref:pyridoxal phosphate-dependent decarboxylase family protein n=1 Tax=Rhizobium sp. TH2 TaxID=2775403 RepID=UPI002157074B|nr:aspartate aminotransferase family protein [Rhizobium sp. TH2]UVC10960.1 aspartate aminotransferase family protein [Rhizobium sp. TH2]
MDIAALFSQAAREAARFREGSATRPHHPARMYADCVDLFSEPLPEAGISEDAVIRDLVEKAEPGLHAMTGPRFHGWVIGGSHPVGVAADMLTSAWGQNAGNHIATPSAAAAELIAGRWLVEMLGLPPSASVGFVTGATMANFTGLAAARSFVLDQAGWDADRNGLFGAPQISVVIGDDAHTTVFSALQFLGLGHDRVVRVPTDEQGRMVVPQFERAIASVEGPVIVIVQAGQINTGCFDDFTAIVPMAKARGAWVHVDGAFGLWAQVTSSYRHLTRGVELADSWATDGHKWLQTPYDCGYAIVRNEAVHRRAMTIAASYLPAAAEDERDPSHYVPELSRRARGFATLAVIKHLGRAGIAEMIERNCAAARRVAELATQEVGIGVVNDVVLNQAIIRFGGHLGDEAGDAMTVETVAELQRDGRLFAGGAKWRGRQVMRLSVCNYQTDLEQAEIDADAIIKAYRIVRARNARQGQATAGR